MIAECCGFLADVLGVALCLQWSCSSSAAACSIASADCSCRVSGPPAQPGFYEVRITQHKNIIHIGRRARQCGCGGWRAASCGWPGPGRAREKAGPRTCKYAKCRHQHRAAREDDRTGAPPPVSGQWGGRGGAATNGEAGPSCELSLHVNEMLVADDIGHIHACQAAGHTSQQTVRVLHTAQ